MTGEANNANGSVIGTILDDRYRIVRELGRGGMGTVYEAHHTGIDRRLAVKVLHAEAGCQGEVLERFRREARITGSLGHPNVVQVTDTGTTPAGAPYLVMEYLEGRSLAQMLRSSGPLPIDQTLEIMLPVLRALSAVHAAGVIHRDIKPENVFLAEGIEADGSAGTVIKVLDFGISKPTAPQMTDGSITATGAILGTPFYMPPEQVRGRDVDHRTDLYACGVILYLMLTGRAPFEGDNPGDLFAAILTEQPPPLSSLRPDLPAELEAVVHRAMAKDKDARFGSADELARALEPFTNFAPAEDELPVVSGPKKRWGLVIGGIAAVAAAITVAALLGLSPVSGSGSETTDTNTEAEPSPTPAPTAEVLPRPVASDPEPEGGPSEVGAIGIDVPEEQPAPEPPHRASTGETSVPAPHEVATKRRAPPSPAPVPPPAASSPSTSPARPIATDIDEQRPEGRRIVTDIDDRLPGR